MRKNYILLPNRGVRSRAITRPVNDFLNLLHTSRYTAKALSLKPRSVVEERDNIELQVLDSIQENGAKLVEVNEQNIAELRLSYPGVLIVPEVFYKKALAPRPPISARPAAAKAVAAKYMVTVLSANGRPVEKAEVFLFTNYKKGEGAKAFTNRAGVATFNMPSFMKADRMYIYPLHSHWPRLMMNPQFKKNALPVNLVDIDTSFRGALDHFYPPALRTPVSSRIKIGVIDTGVGPHEYITVKGGANLVRDEKPEDYHDNGDGHGTHVAGIIAGMGDGELSGFRGLAPGASIYSYRVFGGRGTEASSFAIMKAINKAVEDGCDLLNLSLGSTAEDSGIADSIAEAYNRGVVCFAATGNEDRGPVCFPACAQFSIAVSAMGRKKTWPDGSLQADMVKSPYGNDKNNFVASFSNTGAQVDLTAPGVAIISGYPGNLFSVLDGTSMAAPAATAITARLLNLHPEILNLPRNANRANEIIKLVSAHAASLGFGPHFEGKGMLAGG